MKIVLFGNNLKFMLHFRGAIIKSFLDDGFTVFVISKIDISTDSLFNQHKNFYLLDIDLHRGLVNPIHELKTIKQLEKHLQLISPAIIFSYGLKQCLYSSFTTTSAKRINLLTGLGSSILNRKYRVIVKFVFFLLKCRFLFAKNKPFWCFLNADDYKEFSNLNILNEKNAEIFPGEGVSLSQYPFESIANKDTTNFLFIGRLINDKGIREYIQAAEIIKAKNKNVNFVVIGAVDPENPSRADENIFQQMQQASIVYIAYTEDIKSHIANTHAVVLPSYSEGVPRVLLEAMSIGRPIIATDVNGCRELVVDGVNGYLCEVKSVASLVQAMEKIINAPLEVLQQFGAISRELVEKKFSEKHVIDKYHALLGKIVNKVSEEKVVDNG